VLIQNEAGHKIVRMNEFKPREYQLPFFKAFEDPEKKHSRFLVIAPRRMGKDYMAFVAAVRALLMQTMTCYYIFPEFASGRRILWDAITNDGRKMMDVIPPETIKDKNEQLMRIRFKNDSVFQVIGSDRYDKSIVGTNPKLMVFSEFALQDPRAFQLSSPILRANGGRAVIISTPRGKNHLWDMYQIAQNLPDWWVTKLTIEDTQHIPMAEIEKELSEGIMSYDLVQQEYYTSFELGVEGSYYAKYLDLMRLDGRITDVPWQPGIPVHTAWDLGYNDPTCILFFQIIGQSIHIINYYENNQKGGEHYAKIVQQKDYTYGKHIAPHDIAVHDNFTGAERYKSYFDLGIRFIKPHESHLALTIEDGIEKVRKSLPKMWIDSRHCAPLIKALENYRQEYDIKKQTYKPKPLHNFASHACFTSDTLVLTRTGMRPIIDIKDNEEVLTVNGWEKCLEAKSTRKNVNVIQVIFADGARVKCTPDHLFLTTEGWISAENLGKGSMILSPLVLENKITMDDRINYSITDITNTSMEKDCIESCGVMPSVKFHLNVISIIKITIQKIMHYLTYFVYQFKNIYVCLNQIAKDLVKKQDLLLQNGMEVKQEENGIVNTLLESRFGKNKLESKECACSAQNLQCSFKEKEIPKSSVTQTAKHLMVEGIEKVEGLHDVWCINVPNTGHFSLSNGAIVSNSDAMRYLCGALDYLKPGTTPEQLNARYQQARHGDNSNHNLPNFFRDSI
jgi:hypothetical protein